MILANKKLLIDDSFTFHSRMKPVIRVNFGQLLFENGLAIKTCDLLLICLELFMKYHSRPSNINDMFNSNYYLFIQ